MRGGKESREGEGEGWELGRERRSATSHFTI